MTLPFDLRSWNIDKVTFGYKYSITPKNAANPINGRPRRSLVTDRQTNRQTNKQTDKQRTYGYCNIDNHDIQARNYAFANS